MTMKRVERLPAKTRILILVAVLLVVAGVTAYATFASTPTNGDRYELVHNLPDLEYVLPWDTIASACPDMNDYTKYEKQEAYMGRGNAGGFISLDSNSPAMWMIARVVNKITQGGMPSVRNLSVFMWYFETEEEFNEHMSALQTQGISVQTEGNLLTAVVEQETPIQSTQLVVAGNHICILIANFASPDETLFFSKEDLMDLLPTIKSKISSIEITPLPFPRIPRR
jgi:hypothetical protein